MSRPPHRFPAGAVDLALSAAGETGGHSLVLAIEVTHLRADLARAREDAASTEVGRLVELARAEGRRAGIEEAASAVDRYGAAHYAPTSGERGLCEGAARAIRVLAERGPTP